MAAPRGIEPPTCRLGNRRLIYTHSNVGVNLCHY